MGVDGGGDLRERQALRAIVIQAELGDAAAGVFVLLRCGLQHAGRGRGVRQRVRVPHLLGEHQQKRQQHIKEVAAYIHKKPTIVTSVRVL